MSGHPKDNTFNVGDNGDNNKISKELGRIMKGHMITML